FYHLMKRLSLDVLHHNVAKIVFGMAIVVDHHNVGMREPRSKSGFAFEASLKLAFLAPARLGADQHLERHRTFELELLCEIHNPHSAVGNPLLDEVFAVDQHPLALNVRAGLSSIEQPPSTSRPLCAFPVARAVASIRP